MLLFTLTSGLKQATDGAELDRLLTDISAGDRVCLEELYRATRTSVYSFALSILKNHHDAEDVLQDCYVAVWQSAGRYVSRGKPLAWLLTIAKNLCFQRLREQRRTESGLEDRDLALPDAAALTMEDRTVLRACLEQLSDQERQIVALHAAAGFKHREIAALLELPLPTVLSKYARAIKRLKQYLQ